MCGIVAVITKKYNGFTSKQKDVFSTLLFLDYTRGKDSTGVFLVQNDGDVFVAKEASDAVDFQDHTEYLKLMGKAIGRGSALVGHNRKATRGVINDANAHPFIVDDKVILVHNGTMYGDHKKHADVEVDSHAIAHVIHEKQGDMQAALNEFDAAFALMWYQFDEGVLSILRNNDRPMCMMETDEEWVFASERWMLEAVIARHELKPKHGPEELAPFIHQQFTLGKNGGWTPSYTKLEVKPARQVQVTNYTNDPRYNKWIEETFGGDDAEDVGFNLDARFGDIPFKHGGSNVALLPSPSRGNTRAQAIANSMAQAMDETSSPHQQLPYEFEIELAKKNKVVMPYGQFQDYVLDAYKQETSIYVQSFDYFKNVSGDFYIYATDIDDPDVLCRITFFKNNATEERIVQMAGSCYVFQVNIAGRVWTPLTGASSYAKNAPGVAVIVGNRPKIVDGGGHKDPEFVKYMAGKARVLH